MSTADTDRSKKQTQFVLGYALQIFAVVLILGVLLRAFLISSFVVSTWSMLPSIWPGDFLIAGKWGISRVERGAVVALRCPSSPESVCLRRVIALAGDRVEFLNGVLTINGRASTYRPLSPDVAEERTGGGGGWLVWPAPEAEAPAAGPVVVPPGRLYVLNDRRSDPEDSRRWGPVEGSGVEARVLGIWLSLDWYDGEEVRSWPRLRWPRIFRRVH